MPTYDYYCKNCGYKDRTSIQTSHAKFENILKEPCPKCGKKLEQNYDNVSTAFNKHSKAKLNRIDKKWNKKLKKRHHEKRVSKDPYYDMRGNQ